MLRRYFMTFLLAASLPSAHAAYTDQIVYAGLGVISHSAQRLSALPSHQTSLITSLYSEVVLSAYFNFGAGWGLSPRIGYTPLGQTSPEGGERTTLLPIALRLTRQLGPVGLRLGPGTLSHRVSGAGGTAILANGNESAAVFAIPADAATAKLYFVDVGLGFKISRMRLDFDTLILAPFSSTRRTFNLLASLTYGLF